MRMRDVMTTDVETIVEAVSAEAALERMRRAGIHHLVVVRGREVRGLVSDRDLAGGEDGTVGERMTEDAVTATPATTVRQAANLLRGRRIGCLPIVDTKGKVVGIVTISDLLELLGRGAERVVPAPLRRPQRRGPRRKASAAPYGVR